MSTPSQFPAFIVSALENETQNSGAGSSAGLPVNASVDSVSVTDLDPGDVLVRVTHSALNYKDALASVGNRGVARKLPLIPGVDAVGEVVESASSNVATGDSVLIAAAEFGTAHHGGLSSYARVPADWVYPIASSWSPLDAVTWGTAGFTAAQSVERLVDHGVKPENGDVLVTGGTGGVGIFAIKLLSKLGYRVVAASGKLEHHDWLKHHGAAEVLTREDVCDESESPMLKSRWAGAIDSVGGQTLSSVIRSAKLNSCITACGLVGGHELALTVYPFILRGVTLCGIDSANIPRQTRIDLWNKIANIWQVDLAEIRREIGLSDVGNELKKMLAGNSLGRAVVVF